MRASLIYPQTLQELRLGTRRIIHQGGQNSGKTVNILGALAHYLNENEDEPNVCTVTSMSFPHLKGGALRDFEMYVYPSFKHAIKKYHRTDHVFTFNNGWVMEFKVFENEETARGPKRKILFVNEANKQDYMTFFQLDSRSDQTIIDYNPSIRFWAHEKLIGQPGNVQFISDHRHNPFLSEQKHREIESLCTFKRNEMGELILDDKGKPIVEKGDYELWKVYARGLTGNVQGVIFPNWDIIDENDYPCDEEQIYSVDFGYTNDPTCIIQQCRIGDTIFIREIAYETGLAPMSIKNLLMVNGFNIEESPFFCEHDPDMIKALRKVGLSTAIAARKGPGSIKAGIELLNRHRVKYTSSSRNIHRERSLYVWAEDKLQPGKFLNVPVDLHNHCFDAIRYGAYSSFLREEHAR